MSWYRKVGGVLGPWFGIVVLLAGAKLIGVLHIPWVVVFAPLWVFVVVMVFVVLIVVFVIGGTVR